MYTKKELENPNQLRKSSKMKDLLEAMFYLWGTIFLAFIADELKLIRKKLTDNPNRNNH